MKLTLQFFVSQLLTSCDF